VATGKPVILVVLAGRPLELKWAAGHVPAILEGWSPGVEAGHALANVLLGDVNPSGKLPSSFPRAVGQEPLYYAQLPTGRPARGDLSHLPTNAQEKFVSRYMDEDNSALFPFGWGLSYTRFSYAQPTITGAAVAVKQVLATRDAPVATVGVDVKNTGSVAGPKWFSSTYGTRPRAWSSRAGAERLCAGDACSGRNKTRGVPSGLQRVELL